MERITWKVSPSFFALAFFFVLCRQSTLFAWYMLAVSLHECSHAVAARKLGYRCNVICLSAFGAVLYGEFLSLPRRDEIVIALAGPLCNLVLALCFVALWWIAPVCFVFTQPFVWANLTIALTNLLPCYPLDGGRVWLALFSGGKTTAGRALQIIGSVLSVLLFCAFLLSLFGTPNFTLGLFAVFLFSGGIQMKNERYYRRLLSKEVLTVKLKRGAVLHRLVVPQEMPLWQIAKRIGTDWFEISVFFNERELATINSLQLLELLQKFPPQTSVGEACRHRNDF